MYLDYTLFVLYKLLILNLKWIFLSHHMMSFCVYQTKHDLLIVSLLVTVQEI